MSNERKLLNAAMEGRIEEVNALLAFRPQDGQPGIDVNTTDNGGNSALWLAAAEGHAEVVNALLAAGADVNARGYDGYSALGFAAMNGHTEAVKALLAFQPHHDQQTGIDVNASKPVNGNTALHEAAMNGHTEATQALLGFPGIDVNARNNSGDTALDVATRNDDKKIIELIKKHQAGKKVANFAETNFEHAKYRGPDPDTGHPGGWGFQELAKEWAERNHRDDDKKGGKKYKRTKKSRKYKRTKTKLKKYRKTRAKLRK